MRVAAIVLVLLLAAPLVHAAPWKALATHGSSEPGWWIDSFELVDSTSIWVSFAARSSGEVTGHMIALYTDSQQLVRGTTFFSVGGQIVEITAKHDGATVTTDGSQGALVSGGVFQRNIIWECDAACNPTRKFHLVVTSGGVQDQWGYGLMTQGGLRIAQAHGNEAWAHTTREFDGEITHVGAPLAGVHVVDEGTLAARADDMMLVTFVKPSSTPPRVMEVDGPSGTVGCPCFGGDWPAGDYTFRYADSDVRGIEGFLTYADVRFP